MRWRDSLRLDQWQKMDAVAVMLAVVLAVACLARGAVDDAVLALALLACLPLLFVAVRSPQAMYLQKMSGIWLASFVAIVVIQRLQWSVGGAPHDATAWMHAMGRVLFFVVVAVVALAVGARAATARLFLTASLVTGTLLVAATFFLTQSGATQLAAPAYYSHGLVNANNAAAYLGLLWLLALAQGIEFLRCPIRAAHKMLLDALDRLEIRMLVKGGALSFAFMLMLAGLLRTGSRGGVAISLLCAAGMLAYQVVRATAGLRYRQAMVAAVVMAMAAVVLWISINFGQSMLTKWQANGVDSNSRLAIYAAVLPMVADHPLLGTGLGSFPAAFQRYRPETISSDGMIDKAHNSYLEFAAEMGIPAFMLLMAWLGAIGKVLLQAVRRGTGSRAMALLGMATWLLAALYSLIDFPLQIPGVAAFFLAVVLVCTAQTDPQCYDAVERARPVKRRRIRKRMQATISS